MGFWTQKTHTEKKSWSVVLNPLRSELDKKRVAEKIGDLFRLSYEEARELVESTPLILLDELPESHALQLQDIFQGLRADITVTSDSAAKRRCYRAVWPETPNLSFLSTAPSESGEGKSSGAVESATEEPVEAPAAPPAPPVEEEQKSPTDESIQILEKRNHELKFICGERDREIEALKQNHEKEVQSQRERDASEMRSALQDWEERYQGLKEESQETKSILEEKVLAKEREYQSLREQVQELVQWKERANELIQQREENQSAKALLEGQILQKEREFQALKEQVKELLPWHEKAMHLENQNRNFSEKLNHLEASRRSLEQAVKENAEAVSLWREKYQSLAHKSERYEALYEEERKRRELSEEARRTASESADRMRLDLETQQAEAEKWRIKFQELEESQKRLEEEFSQFTVEQNNELRRLKENNHDLSMQLESAQRQARDLLFRVEQQDLIEKRTRLANELSAKEARLRELALDNEKLRQEIQDRELRVQTVAGEQANLEREILETKQAQRYLLEQSKLKEKAGKFKRASPPSATKSLSESELRIENG